METSKTILLFDGYCNMCNNSVKFVLKKEKKTELYFASLQSNIAIKLLTQYHLIDKKIDSLVLIEKNTVYLKSSAALRICKYLKGLYPLLFIFIIVPPFIRNGVYDYIAKHRYKWFGKSDSCMMPGKELKERFL